MKKCPEPVCVEVLKAKDVQQADGQEGGSGAFGQPLVDDGVYFLNDPYEQLIVDCLKDQPQITVEFQLLRI